MGEQYDNKLESCKDIIIRYCNQSNSHNGNIQELTNKFLTAIKELGIGSNDTMVYCTASDLATYDIPIILCRMLANNMHDTGRNIIID